MPSSIHAIACAVDFSPFSALVVAQGVELVRRTGARLYLIHCVHDPQDGAHATAVFERGGDLEKHQHDARRRLRHLMTAADIAWEPVIRFGDPVEQTLAVVADLSSCLVISASHGISGFRRLFVGTVVERLSRALTCPMLVVKPGTLASPNPPQRYGSVVVTCDRRGHWQRLASLLPLLQPDESPCVHLVHALEGPMDETPSMPAEASYDQVQQAHQDRLIRRIEERAARLFPHAVRVSAMVGPGIPQEMALETAHEQGADLMTVGVRRTGRVGRWLAGSTTEALLRRSPCSVLTVPEADGEPAGREVER